MQRGRVNTLSLLVTNYGVIHNGWRDGVLVRALSLLPRGVLGTLQHSQGKQGVFLCEGDMANSPDEVPLHERTQHGKQTGRAGSYHAARKL